MGTDTLEEFKENKKKKVAQMTAMQALPYEVKVKRAERRAWEFIEKLDELGLNAHVSVGGLDSITLLFFLRKIGIDVPAISVSLLEDKDVPEDSQGDRRYQHQTRENQSGNPTGIWFPCIVKAYCRKNRNPAAPNRKK